MMPLKAFLTEKGGTAQLWRKEYNAVGAIINRPFADRPFVADLMSDAKVVFLMLGNNRFHVNVYIII